MNSINQEYQNDLANFLEETDYLQNGITSQQVDNYLELEDYDYYNKLENKVPGITECIQADGDSHLQEYEQHVYNSNNYNQLFSLPTDEPYINGQPYFTHYTELDLQPYKNETTLLNYPELIQKIIGVGGINFIDITHASGVHYIWLTNRQNLDSERHPDYKASNDIIQIWGHPSRLHTAILQLKLLIQQKIEELQKQKTIILKLTDIFHNYSIFDPVVKQNLINIIIGTQGCHLNNIIDNTYIYSLNYEPLLEQFIIKGLDKSIQYAKTILNTHIIDKIHLYFQDTATLHLKDVLNKYDSKLIGAIIGTKGCHLKSIQKECGINKLYFDNGTFIIQGYFEYLDEAIKMLKGHILLCSQSLKNNI